MTFLAPGFLLAGLAVAAAVVALHFIVTRQPRSSILPTARFVPDTRATTVASARRPSDLLVMLLRVVTVLAAATALAKPIFEPTRRAEARVILVDVSRSTPDPRAILDSARIWYRDGDAFVLFDSSARMISGNVGDSVALSRSTNRGNLSAALIAALRAGSSLRDRADSLELVIVSPFASEEFDAATDSIRRLWPGRARLIRTTGLTADTSGPPGTLQIAADREDPLAISAALARNEVKSAAFIDRSPARENPAPKAAGPTIDWPAVNRPRGAVPRNVDDTVGGVISGDARVVAAFERRWSYPGDSLRGAEVIARWVDGEPAAIERPETTGCSRSVAIPVTPIGDLPIRKEFVRLVASLSRPCAGVTSLIPADPSEASKLSGTGGLAPRAAFQPRTDSHSAIAPWALALALLAAIGELFVRRRARAADSIGREKVSRREARAA